MMSLDVIHQLQEEAAIEAEERGRNPAVMDVATIKAVKSGDLSVLNIPNLGTYLPKNFERVSLEALGEEDTHGVFMGDNEGYGAYFVDKSSFGADDEPAMSLRQFIGRLRVGYGYAVVEEGQFQVKVGVFRFTGDYEGRR